MPSISASLDACLSRNPPRPPCAPSSAASKPRSSITSAITALAPAAASRSLHPPSGSASSTECPASISRDTGRCPTPVLLLPALSSSSDPCPWPSSGLLSDSVGRPTPRTRLQPAALRESVAASASAFASRSPAWTASSRRRPTPPACVLPRRGWPGGRARSNQLPSRRSRTRLSNSGGNRCIPRSRNPLPQPSTGHGSPCETTQLVER
jgi:hypothetical protein